jgi:hypothetical protein
VASWSGRSGCGELQRRSGLEVRVADGLAVRRGEGRPAGGGAPALVVAGDGVGISVEVAVEGGVAVEVGVGIAFGVGLAAAARATDADEANRSPTTPIARTTAAEATAPARTQRVVGGPSRRGSVARSEGRVT